MPFKSVSRFVRIFQAIAFVGGIGAGVLGLPYAVAKVGLPIGIPYIVAIGLLMLGVNLLVGEVLVRTRKNIQLAGLAKLYLGRWAEILMVAISYTLLFGTLVIYIIGEGKTLSALFPGTAFFWSLVFFGVASLIVFLGMNMVKKMDIVLMILLTLVLVLIITQGFFHIDPAALESINAKNIFLPYGVLVFAFHAISAIPEAYSVVRKKQKDLRTALVVSSTYNIVMYILFAIAVVGVLGAGTTEIATIGLGQKIGRQMLFFGNIFAATAMGMMFLNLALSLRDSFQWDFKLSARLSSLIACGVPLILFLLGLRKFIDLIDIMGGVVMSIEMLLIVLIYWRAKHLTRPSKSYVIHHAALLLGVVILAFSFATVYNVVNLF